MDEHSSLFLVKKDILASALPGVLPRQALRFPTTLVEALDDLTEDETVFRYFSHLQLVASGAVLGDIAVCGDLPSRQEGDPCISAPWRSPSAGSPVSDGSSWQLSRC